MIEHDKMIPGRLSVYLCVALHPLPGADNARSTRSRVDFAHHCLTSATRMMAGGRCLPELSYHVHIQRDMKQLEVPFVNISVEDRSQDLLERKLLCKIPV